MLIAQVARVLKGMVLMERVYLAAFAFYIFAHIHAIVPIYLPKCNPLHLLFNGVFYLDKYAFV